MYVYPMETIGIRIVKVQSVYLIRNQIRLCKKFTSFQKQVLSGIEQTSVSLRLVTAAIDTLAGVVVLSSVSAISALN